MSAGDHASEIRLHLLPAELYVYIIQTAAYLYRFSDRQSVVNLAMSCRAVYDIVCPVLHHTLILTRSNTGRLVSLTSDEETHALAERILPHVRCFHNHSAADFPFDPRLLVNIECIETRSWSFINSLVHTHLKTVCSANLDFLETVSHLVPESIRTVTHMSGLLPMFRDNFGWNSFFIDPASWMRSLLENLPAVTHLGLRQDYSLEFDYHGSVALYDYEAVGTAIRTALRVRPGLQCIAIRTCGLHAEMRRTDLETVVCDIRDPRVKVWFDMREGWGEDFALRIRDITEGRSLWMEARPL